jgi:NAD dependent epimerase/dehydratase
VVTGAEGFIGSHLVEALLEAGAEVRAFVHYNPDGRWGWLHHLAGEIEVLSGDVRDAGRVTTALAGRDMVFHLAALIGIPYSYEAPESYVQTNVVGTYNVVTAARHHGLERVVHTSTSEVYGTARRVPIGEDHPLQPQSPYSATKIGADMLALSFFHAFAVPVAIVRPFNTYGPRQSSRAIIPTVLRQLLDGVPEVRVGTTAPTRDFNFVTDTASGFLAVAGSEQALGNVVNVGSGREISIGDLIELLMEITGHRVPVVSEQERLRPGSSEVQRLLCDNARAREWAGWEPKVALEEGLARVADWLRRNPASGKAAAYQI